MRALVLIGDGEVLRVYLVPEAAMSEDAMGPVHEAAGHCTQRIANVVPDRLRTLRGVRAAILRDSGVSLDDLLPGY